MAATTSIIMRRSWLGCVLLITCVCACACGSSDKRLPVPTSNGPDSGPYTGPNTDKSDAGVDPLAPIVEFVSPAPASDPNGDTVITDSTVVVRCRAKRGTVVNAAAVDKTSIKITLEQADDATKVTTAAINALSNDEYEGTFELGKRPNGLLRFHCTALDTGSKVKTSRATLETLIDLGPTIEVMEPSLKIYALKARVPIEFLVTPSPLGDSDNEQAVHEVKLTVGGVDIPVEASTVKAGLYQTSVDFDDRVRFPVPPSAVQISISASDQRSPVAATRVQNIDLGIDAAGPTIKIENPRDGEIVHGNRALEVTVTDPSGVQTSSLVATFNKAPMTNPNWVGTAPKFSTTFDTGSFGIELTQLTINVTVSDTVGNESTASIGVKLDNRPPVLSLDPPDIFEVKKSGYCSAAFDPLGDDAPNDLEYVSNSARYRVLVEDDTNHPLGTTNESPFVYLAGVDKASVTLYMQHDVSVPLLIDASADSNHHCDEINNGDKVPVAKHPISLLLSPVNPSNGGPWYPKFDAMNSANLTCYDPNGASTDSGKRVCDNWNDADMRRVVFGRSADHPPAVYGYRPANACMAEFAGESWELLGVVPQEGWICLAARAVDVKGNIGVSAPLRICWDDPAKPGEPACKTDKSNPPSCTDGCTINANQRFASGLGWPQP
jgi:hypothetical protein